MCVCVCVWGGGGGGGIMVHVYVRRGVCGGEWCVPAFFPVFSESHLHV